MEGPLLWAQTSSFKSCLADHKSFKVEKKSSQDQINLEILYIIFNYWEVKMHINIGFKKYF